MLTQDADQLRQKHSFMDIREAIIMFINIHLNSVKVKQIKERLTLLLQYNSESETEYYKREKNSGSKFSKEFMNRMVMESVNRKIAREIERIEDLIEDGYGVMLPMGFVNRDQGKVAFMSHYLDTYEDESCKQHRKGQSTNDNSDELVKVSNGESKSDVTENQAQNFKVD